MIRSSQINGRHVGVLYHLQYINTISLSPHTVSVSRASLDVQCTSRLVRGGEEERKRRMSV